MGLADHHETDPNTGTRTPALDLHKEYCDAATCSPWVFPPLDFQWEYCDAAPCSPWMFPPLDFQWEYCDAATCSPWMFPPLDYQWEYCDAAPCSPWMFPPLDFQWEYCDAAPCSPWMFPPLDFQWEYCDAAPCSPWMFPPCHPFLPSIHLLHACLFHSSLHAPNICTSSGSIFFSNPALCQVFDKRVNSSQFNSVIFFYPPSSPIFCCPVGLVVRRPPPERIPAFHLGLSPGQALPLTYLISDDNRKILSRVRNSSLHFWFMSTSFSIHKRDVCPFEADTNERHSLLL